MEQFSLISGVILTLVAAFGFGWAAHVFFHRRNHDKLTSKVSSLEKALKEAKEGQKVAVKSQNISPEAIEKLKLSDDEITLLQFINAEGVFGPPDDLSMSRAQLAVARLTDKALVGDDEHGMYVTRLALEWMDNNKLLK